MFSLDEEQQAKLFQSAMESLSSGDDSRAARMLKKAADAGHVAAKYRYALLLASGQGVEVDLSAALANIEQAARGGNVLAQYTLGSWLFPITDSEGKLKYFGPGWYRQFEPDANVFVKKLNTKAGDNVQLKFAQATGPMWPTWTRMNPNYTFAFADARVFYEMAAKQGYPFAAYAVAFIDLICDLTPKASKHRFDSISSYLHVAMQGNIAEAFYTHAWLTDLYDVPADRANGDLEAGSQAALLMYQRGGALGSEPSQHHADEVLGYQLFKKSDYEQAFCVISKWSETFRIESKFALAVMKYEGWGCEKDCAAAASLFKDLYDKNWSFDGAVEGYLGECFLEGSGFNSDVEKAVYLFRQSDQRGFRYGTVSMGWCYEKGLGVEQNLFEALSYYDKAIENASSKDSKKDRQSSRIAAQRIFVIVRDNPSDVIGRVSDQAAVDKALEVGAELGVPLMQLFLGDNYKDPQISENAGRSVNYTKAKYWLEKAINNPDTEPDDKARAQYELAECLLDSDWQEAECDEKTAVFQRIVGLLDLAIAGNYTKAYVRRAECYAHEGNHAKAAETYAKGAEKDAEGAHFGYGLALFEGTGVEQDFAAARRELELSCELESEPQAYGVLGYLYEEGIGCEPDLVRAVSNYEKGAALDDCLSLNNLAACLLEGRGTDKNEERAKECLLRAAKLGDEDAQEWLANNTQSAAEQLESLIGLKSVKAKVNELQSSMKFERDRAAAGFDVQQNANRHMLFLGNPGTGKTTVARIMARVLYEMGIISNNTVKEVDAGDLKAGYFGHSQEKVRSAFDEADGGVLFIDEAYGLKSGDQDSIGQEAVDAIVKLMEDRRGSIVVIMAGYEKEMQEFLESNSGLKSRFPAGYTFHFEDYKPEELLQIFKLNMDKQGFQVDEDALEYVLEDFTKAVHVKDFGNGRYASNFVQNVIERHQAITYNPDDPSTLTHIVAADIPGAKLKDPAEESEPKQSAVDELNELVGLARVKEEVQSMQAALKAQRVAKELGMDLGGGGSHHMLFLGNPGTGKTTVAHIIARILHELSIIPTDKVTTVKREDLVGQYLGQTAPKVHSVFDTADGGVLIIDEAYSLYSGQNDTFGQEAINTIVPLMSERSESIVVVMAGYEREMADFLAANSGLRRRFNDNYVFHFEDYSPEEMVQIFTNMLRSKGFEIDEDISAAASSVLEQKRTEKGEAFGNAGEAANLVESVIRYKGAHLDPANIDSFKHIVSADILNA